MNKLPDKSGYRNARTFVMFRAHLTLYIATLVLATIGFSIFSRDRLSWVLYVAIGWGICLLIHFLIAYFSIRRQDRSTGYGER